MVIWIIGKSGAGKTFFANKINIYLKKKKINVFWIDGDEFRKYISNDLGYSIKDRKENSLRVIKFCKYLEKKGYLVLCSFLSIFKNHQKKNKSTFKKYLQIFINVDQKILVKRNKKKIYSKKKNVVGKDIKFLKPKNSNLVINNDFQNYKTNLKYLINEINEKIKKKNFNFKK
tara:strand:- start:14140 stop:14658 length:519 start_codon:yes stop_codon:yes gene_type:complete